MSDAAGLGAGRNHPVRLDIVIPVFNEEDIIDHLMERLQEIFSGPACGELGLAGVNYILVDDGSADRSPALINAWIRKGAPITLLRLSRNFGHQAAVSAGLSESRGDVTVIMDADLQDPPELVPQMLGLWRAGNDVVYGRRSNRKESFFKVGSYWLFYRLLNFLSNDQVPLDSGDFCLMDARVVQAVNNLPEVLRFPRGLRAWVGFKQIGLVYDRPGREYGSTKYSFKKLYALATDGITAMSIRPLKVSQLFSFFMALISLIILCLLLWRFFFSPDSGIDLGLMLLLFFILTTSTVQLLSIYILGAYVGRTYLEIKRRPTFIIDQKITNREGSPECPENITKP